MKGGELLQRYKKDPSKIWAILLVVIVAIFFLYAAGAFTFVESYVGYLKMVRLPNKSSNYSDDYRYAPTTEELLSDCEDTLRRTQESSSEYQAEVSRLKGIIEDLNDQIMDAQSVTGLSYEEIESVLYNLEPDFSY